MKKNCGKGIGIITSASASARISADVLGKSAASHRALRMLLADVPKPEWRPLKIIRAMELAIERCKELTSIPSRTL